VTDATRQIDRDALGDSIATALNTPDIDEERITLGRDIERSLNMTEDEISASFVNQLNLGKPGMENDIARLALADADTAGEKITAFNQHYPDGDLKVAPVTGDLLFRENASAPYRKVDAGLMQRFEPMGDLIDFLGPDIGAIIGELVVSKGASSFLSVITRMFLGGFFGETAQQGVQTVRGVQQQDLGEVVSQANVQGGFSAIGGGVGLGLGKGLEAMSGGPSLSLAPGAEQAVRAGDRLGLERNLTVGESIDNPILKKIEGQSGATLPTIQRYMTARAGELRDVVKKMGDKKEARKLLKSDELARANRAERAEILQMMKGSQPRSTLSEGGEALNNGIGRYHKRSSQRVTAAYVRARNIEEPAFQISELQQLAREVQESVPFEKTPIETPGSILGLDGKPLATVIEKGGQGRAGEALRGDVSAIIRQIRDAHPGLPPTVASNGLPVPATEQLRAWRSALWDAKTPAVGENFTNQHRQAGRLYDKITDILKDPSGSPAFRKEWGIANGMAAERFRTLDQLLVMKGAKSETPAQLARRLANPNQVDNLRVLRESIPSEQFAKFQDAVKFDLLENADSLTKRLNSFDKATLDTLLSPVEQGLFRKMGTKIDALNSLKVREIIQRQTKVGAAVRDMFTRNDTASISLLSEMVEKNGGQRGPLGRQLRSAIIEDFKERVLIKEGGVTSVSPAAIEAAITEFRNKGVTKFLTMSDMKTLANLDEFLPFIRSSTDSGTSLQAASAAAGLRGNIASLITGQSLATSSLQTVAEHAGVGWLFTTGAPALRGTGKRKARRAIKGPMSKAVALLSLASNDKGAYDPTLISQLEIAVEQ